MPGRQPGRTLLATFVHISDIHIGEIDAANGDARTSPAAAKVYSNFPWLDGLLGHSGRALHELDHFVASVRASEPDARLVVTGDLSRFGASGELRDAHDYLHGQIDLAPSGTKSSRYCDAARRQSSCAWPRQHSRPPGAPSIPGVTTGPPGPAPAAPTAASGRRRHRHPPTRILRSARAPVAAHP